MLETLDKFVNHKILENKEKYYTGYRAALVDVLEMIENEISYNEVYESINNYLIEKNKENKKWKDIMINRPSERITKANKDFRIGMANDTINQKDKEKYSNLSPQILKSHYQNKISKRSPVGFNVYHKKQADKMNTTVYGKNSPIADKIKQRLKQQYKNNKRKIFNNEMR